jgi:ribosomal protein S18 acetylase RimI-like enzyme
MIVITRVINPSHEIVSAFEKLIPQLTHRLSPSIDELAALVNSSSILLIARYPDNAGPIVGSGTLGVFRTPTGLHAHIEDVIVDEDLRGRRIGEALVRELLNAAKELGVEGVSLTCNSRRTAANRLYEKLGFKNWDTNVYWYDLSEWIGSAK